MSCHFTCTSACSGTNFNQCAICDGAATLVNNACFCATDWNSSCTFQSTLEAAYQSLESFYMVLFPLVMLLYCLKVKLPFSYRIVVGLQGLSLLVFSNQIYLYFENQFGLTFLAKSNGFYNHSNRLQSFSIKFALGPFVLLGCFMVALLGLYPLTNAFQNTYEEYTQYLKDNVIHFLNSFYFFASRMMFYFIGLWINSLATDISIILPFCLFTLIILLVLVKLFYDFHKNNLSEAQVYQPQLNLYSMLSSVPMVGLPFVSSPTIYITIYLVPLGLLIMIMLLNKGYEICTKTKVFFYLIQIVMAGLIIAFILASDPIRSYVLFGTISLSILAIVIEMAILYHSGVDLSRSSKVHPEAITSQENNSLEGQFRKVKKHSKTGATKKSYF